MSIEPNRITRDEYLLLMNSHTRGTCNARSKRAAFIAKKAGHTQYNLPGRGNEIFYDPAEALRDRGGKALPKAA